MFLEIRFQRGFIAILELMLHIKLTERCVVERMANSKCKQTNVDFCFTFCTVHGCRSIWDDIHILNIYLIYRLRLSQSYLPHHNKFNTDTTNKINNHMDTFLLHCRPFFQLEIFVLTRYIICIHTIQYQFLIIKYNPTRIFRQTLILFVSIK